MIDLGHDHTARFFVWDPDLALNPQYNDPPLPGSSEDPVGAIIDHKKPDGSICSGAVHFDTERTRRMAETNPVDAALARPAAHRAVRPLQDLRRPRLHQRRSLGSGLTQASACVASSTSNGNPMDDDHDKDEQSFEDGLVVLRAGIDQLIATSAEMARAAFGMFTAFKAEGFSDRQALYLTAVQLKDSPGAPPSE